MSLTICAKAFASTPISPPASSGGLVGSPRPKASTASVICASGRANERDSRTARISATTTAIALVQTVAWRTASEALMMAE